MKVLFISTSQGGRGGGEYYFKVLVEALSKLCDITAEVAMSRDPSMDWLADALDRLGVGVHRAGIRNLFDYRTRAIGCYLDPRNRTCVARLINSVKPDIIHVNQQNCEDGLDLVRTAQRLIPGRVVGTIHNAQILRSIVTHGRALREWWAGRFHRKVAYHRIFVSAASRRGFEQAIPGYAGHNHVVLNGLLVPDGTPDCTEARRVAKAAFGLPESAVVVGCAGRFTAQKNVQLALRAFASVAGRHPRSMLLLAGDGEEAKNLRRLADVLGVADRVRMPGYLSEHRMDTFYRAIDLFVLSSRWEGFPFVLVESLLRGVPSIATAVDGNVEALDCGQAGILVPPAGLSELAKAMSFMIGDADVRKQYSRKGMAFARSRLTSERMAQETFSVYQRMADNDNPGRS